MHSYYLVIQDGVEQNVTYYDAVNSVLLSFVSWTIHGKTNYTGPNYSKITEYEYKTQLNSFQNYQHLIEELNK